MKKCLAVILAVTLMLLAGCSKPADTIQFHEWTLNRADLSQETIEWLTWYNSLSENDQLAVSYVPHDVLELCGFYDGPEPAESVVAETRTTANEP